MNAALGMDIKNQVLKLEKSLYGWIEAI